MTPQEQLVQALREMALNARHSVTLSLDDSQAWPVILIYADTIEADDPERAVELRHLVTCYKNGAAPVHRCYFTAEEDAQKMIDGALARWRGEPPPAS